ncbi:MAG: hypothetical protein ACLPTQ_25750 [Terriglobales bacterium]
MAQLPPIKCDCGTTIESEAFVPNARGGATTASDFFSCLRRCNTCGIGFSNAKNPSDVQKILRDPFAGLPAYIAEGSESALNNCLNRAHAAAKRIQFHSFGSEDHVTWTVIRLLQHERLLGPAFRHPGLEPVLLVWGVSVPNDCTAGQALRDRVINVLNGLGEEQDYRTEPDVVLDFGSAGIVIIEAKLFSLNESQSESYGGWSKYLIHSAFRDPECAHATGLYQLVRNWRLGTELAGERPFTLFNLAPEFAGNERTGLARLRLAFRTSPQRRFVLRRWSGLLSGFVIPDWFSEYARQRSVPIAQ